MKKSILFIVACTLVTASVTAQRPGRMQDRIREKRTQHHREQLNLSEEQKNKFKSLNEDFRKNLMELRKKDDITVKEWKTRMADLHKQHRSNMQNVFTPDQKARMEKMKQERKQLTEIDARARMEKMKLYLGLSNDQAEKMQKNRVEMREKLQALKNNSSMDPQKKREAYRALLEKNKESMKTILTEEQKKKIQERKRHQPRRPGRLS